MLTLLYALFGSKGSPLTPSPFNLSPRFTILCAFKISFIHSVPVCIYFIWLLKSTTINIQNNWCHVDKRSSSISHSYNIHDIS